MNPKIRTSTVRLPEEMAADVELAARVDGIPASRFMSEAIAAHIRQRRSDPEFQARLRERIAADERLLARLTGEPDPANTDSTE